MIYYLRNGSWDGYKRNLHYVCAARPTAVSPVLMSGSEQTSSYAMMTAPSLCRND